MTLRISTFILTALFALTSSALWPQKVLQIEKRGVAKTKKIFIDAELTYQVKGDDYWYRGAIKDFLVEENIIVFYDRFVHVDSIAAFRYDRQKMGALGKQVLWFGLAWSAYALVGTATDGNPETHYEWSDAAVTGASALTGWIIPKLFRYKLVKFGKRKRLRLLDLSILNERKKAVP